MFKILDFRAEYTKSLTDYKNVRINLTIKYKLLSVLSNKNMSNVAIMKHKCFIFY